MPRPTYFTPWRVGIFAIALAIGVILALTPFRRAEQFPILGAEAEYDVVAGHDVTFRSPTLTEEAQTEARERVEPQFAYDAAVRSRQLEALRAYLADVVAARAAHDAQRAAADSDTTDESSASATTTDATSDAEEEPAGTAVATVIPQIDNSRLTNRDEQQLISIERTLFVVIHEEALATLDLLLQQQLHDTDLADLRLHLSDQLDPQISFTESALIAALVAAYLQPTMIEDAILTDAARDRAAAAVPSVSLSVVAGDLVVERGEVVDALTAEMLAVLTPDSGGIELESLGAIVILGLAAAIAFGLYLYLGRPQAVASDRRMILLAFLVLLSVVAARAWFEFVLPDGREQLLELMIPVAAGAVLVAALLSTGLGVLTGVLLAVLVGVAAVALPNYPVDPIGPQALRPFAFFLVSSLSGVLVAARAQALAQYGLAGLAAGSTGFIIGAAFWLLGPDRATEQLGWLALASIVTAAGAAVIIIGAFSLLGALFGIITPMRLLELAQLQQPLLRRLQDEAPGTFHHSLLVSTLAERAAAQIGADALLVRVGAYYHDIGKLHHPAMFIENQGDGDNPHEDLDPRDSAQVIIAHVHEGDALARRGRLPLAIRDFINEHHGSRRVAYFYRKAALTDPRTDPTYYTYAGPPPQSRETAIVMLADSCEAVVRASREQDPQTISLLVDSVIDERLRERQLDECDLTLRELQQISASFKRTLSGVHHQRIEYPPASEAEQRERTTRAPAASLPPS